MEQILKEIEQERKEIANQNGHCGIKQWRHMSVTNEFCV